MPPLLQLVMLVLSPVSLWSQYAYGGLVTPKSRTLVLDVDTGVDDALAIGLALGLGADVAAITTVAGNVKVDVAYDNTLRVLRVFDRTDIPVFRGADRPIDGEWNPEEQYFGGDGFGDVSTEYDVGFNAGVATGANGGQATAATKLIELAKARPGQLTLVLLGPPTNAAIALLLDPQFTKDLREIVILGGNIHGRGNVLPGAEFNFHTDPEAAHIVLQRAQCPVTIVPLEASLVSKLHWTAYNDVASRNSSRARFMADVTRHTRQCCAHGSEGFNVGDALAVLTALAPESVVASAERRVTVELDGQHTRGQLTQAWSPRMLPNVKGTVRLVEALDRRLLAHYVTRAFS
ncbi:nucleoside hydrolase-like [Haemaphysalis longicornis]